MTPVSISWLRVQRMPSSTNGRSAADTMERSVSFSPCSHSITSTRRDTRPSSSSGTRTPGGGRTSAAEPPLPYSARNRRRLAASFSKSISSNSRSTNSSTAPTASARIAPLPCTAPAAQRSSNASAATCCLILGRCTFMATSRPRSQPRYTWQREAAATGGPRMAQDTSGSSCSTMAAASSSGKGGKSSCSAAKAPASSLPTMSDREASACPNLT
mmetsp:Transcript_33771/g.95562  ORF Transcript_33771/g.95562 Transcript_33771/m.95562 type:complete len:215 (+) Transcript_33771:1067-1711(+)